MTGIVFNIEKYAIHDGEGIRTLVFLKGCGLACLWCANPEGQCFKPNLVYSKRLCIHCGVCMDICLKGALYRNDDGIKINRELCDSCGDCCRECYSGALELDGREYSVEEVVHEVKKDKIFYDQSGGGVTLSGGEPLYQASFAIALLKALKHNDISTAIETCGFVNFEVYEKAAPWLDFIFFDIKHMDRDKHTELTGQSNQVILDNIVKLQDLKIPMVVRIPVIPGLNDDDKNITETAKFVATLPMVIRIELLPYHRLGIHKYEKLDMKYKINDIETPSNDKMLELKQIIEDNGIKCIVH